MTDTSLIKRAGLSAATWQKTEVGKAHQGSEERECSSAGEAELPPGGGHQRAKTHEHALMAFTVEVLRLSSVFQEHPGKV